MYATKESLTDVYNYLSINFTGSNDFIHEHGIITFMPSDTNFRSINIPIIDDQEIESDESFTVSFSSSNLPRDKQHIYHVTIIDNDVSKYCLSVPAAGTVRLNLYAQLLALIRNHILC